MKRLPPRLEQFIVAIALGGAFLLMASVFVPDFTRADSGVVERPVDPAFTEPSTDPHEGLASLGSLESGRYVVRIYGGENEPLYSIYDAADGTELGVLLTAEKVAEWFPELPLPNMEYGTDSPIMLAEPAHMSEY